MPVFPFELSQLQILYSPSAFHQQLLNNIAAAKDRIVLASLYLGTHSIYERQIVDALEDALQTNPSLQVSWLLDAARAQRLVDGKSSISMLDELCRKYGRRHSIHLFQSLSWSWLSSRLPPRWKEILGVQHMKVYCTDDRLIISGANLSEDYFVDRLDRYWEIKGNDALNDYLLEIVRVVQDHSWCYHPGQKKEKEKHDVIASSHLKTLMANPSLWCRSLEESLDTLKARTLSEGHCWRTPQEGAAILIPALSFGPSNIKDDITLTCTLLQNASSAFLTSGYVFCPPVLMSALRQVRKTVAICAGSPSTHGFANASGVSSLLPSAYSYFFHSMKLPQPGFQRIEWQGSSSSDIACNSNSYHAKGLWTEDDGGHLSSATIGSSNFGWRTVRCDLDLTLHIVVAEPDSRKKGWEEMLEGERKKLWQGGVVSSPELSRQRMKEAKLLGRVLMALGARYFM
jgi:CDP-diacylglycerol---glycerol-3-phosphate 3-phosphatidyltransferase